MHPVSLYSLSKTTQLLRLYPLFLLVVVASGLSAQATPDHSPLAGRLADYARLTMNWEIDSLLDLTDPELFEIVPRTAVRTQLAGLSSDDNIAITFRDFTIDNVGEIVNYQEDGFAPVSCHYGIEFRLLSEDYRAENFQRRMVRMLQKRHGNDQVYHDSQRHVITVAAVKSLYAIRRGLDAKWCFVEYRRENVGLMDLLLPPAVRDRLREQ